MDTKTYSLDIDTTSANNSRFFRLKSGALAFPKINYAKNNQILGETKRLKSSLQKIHTILTEACYAGDLLHKVDFGSSSISDEHAKLEVAIIDALKKYRVSPSAQLGRRIFHSIQLWGGGEGRGIYVRPKQHGSYRQIFELNFGNGENYNSFMECIMKPKESRERKVGHLKIIASRIDNWGLSFASKHMNFISKAFDDEDVPRWYVFDSVISKACFGTSVPKWELYPIYCAELENQAKIENLSGDMFERALFNYLQDDPVGQLWGALRCR